MEYQLDENAGEANIGLMKETLRVVFGLEPNTIARVIRVIKGTEDAADVKTVNIRTRVGARAIKYLRNAIEIARHEGTEKHETETERDMQKEPDLEPEQQKQEKERKQTNHQTNESLTFKDFLITEREVTIAIDPEDPTKTKQEIAAVKRDPQRAGRQEMIDARKEREIAQKEGDPITAKIAALRMQIKQLEDRRAKMAQTSGGGAQ